MAGGRLHRLVIRRRLPATGRMRVQFLCTSVQHNELKLDVTRHSFTLIQNGPTISPSTSQDKENKNNNHHDVQRQKNNVCGTH